MLNRFADADGEGVELLALDKGPGIADLNRALSDGYSTAGVSAAGSARWRARLGSFRDFQPARAGHRCPGAVCRRAGAAGSRTDRHRRGRRTLSGRAGLRRRLGAVSAGGAPFWSSTARGMASRRRAPPRSRSRRSSPMPTGIASDWSRRSIAPCAPTRGAAVAVARVDRTERVVRFVGIGNIAGAMVADGTAPPAWCRTTARPVTSRRASSEFIYPFAGEPTLDPAFGRDVGALGPRIVSRVWRAAHPALIAGVLFRDYRRGATTARSSCCVRRDERRDCCAVALRRDTDIVLARRAPAGSPNCSATICTPRPASRPRSRRSPATRVEHGGGGAIEFCVEASDSPARARNRRRRSRPGHPAARDGDPGRAIAGPGAGLGIGLSGAQRLMDDFAIETGPERGTRITIARTAPAALRHRSTRSASRSSPRRWRAMRRPIRSRKSGSRTARCCCQLQELEQRRDELLQLNQELQDTNRGVVALYAELDERADHLRRADELKSRFLSNMTHEFRTPLNSILALSRLLLDADRRRADAGAGDAGRSSSAIRREPLASWSTTCSTWPRSRPARRRPAGRVHGRQPVRRVARHAAPAAGRRRRRARLRGAAAICRRSVTDEAKVSQILRNFISNALKFTERGEVRVCARLASPTTIPSTFSVRDTGIGIAPENLELIFEEFGQVPGPIQSKVKGTGLGLPLVEEAGGTARRQDRGREHPGAGIGVLADDAAGLSGAAGDTEPAQDFVPDAGRLPVLVVEDNPADAFAIKRALADSPYQALEARTIAAARGWLERLHPAAIVLDVVLLGDEVLALSDRAETG